MNDPIRIPPLRSINSSDGCKVREPVAVPPDSIHIPATASRNSAVRAPRLPLPINQPRARLLDGFQVQRLFLDDLDLAFGRQAQHDEMFAHDVIPIRHNSFVAQSYQRINFRRAARRHPAGKQGDKRHQQRERRERQRVGRAHAEQQLLDKSRHPSAPQNPSHTRKRQLRSLADNQPNTSSLAPSASRMPISRVRCATT